MWSFIGVLPISSLGKEIQWIAEKREPRHGGKKLDRESLSFFARKYVWWKSAEEAAQQPERIIAQVMNIGEFDDIRRMELSVDAALLTQILQRAEIGQFSPRSWTYWHYRLGLALLDEVPAVPSRRLG